MQKATDAMFSDNDCPPWPLVGRFSLYPREDICWMITNPQTGKICGKRFKGKAAANLRSHVRKAYLCENKKQRLPHHRRLELVEWGANGFFECSNYEGDSESSCQSICRFTRLPRRRRKSYSQYLHLNFM